jgi:hypothetical protein
MSKQGMRSKHGKPVAAGPERPSPVRQDLWAAIMDYGSGCRYVWDDACGIARPARPDDAKPFFPTVTLEELARWRAEFVGINANSLDPAGIEEPEQAWPSTNLICSPTTRFATVTACLGSQASSSTTILILRPLTPPASLIAAAAASAPRFISLPIEATGPVIGPATAMAMSWAFAVAVSAESATPASHRARMVRMDLALFVDRQDNRVRRRFDVETDDVAQFVDEFRIFGELELPDAMRLKAMRAPEALRRTDADARRFGHRGARPMRDLARRRLDGQGDGSSTVA